MIEDISTKFTLNKVKQGGKRQAEHSAENV